MSELDPQARWRRLSAILDQALEAAAEERAALLDRACAGDPELRREAEELLRAEAAAPSVLERGVGDWLGPLPEAADDQPVDAEVGRYRLVRQLGEGGMGRVYLAERADGQFERQVALKVIRRGLDSEEVEQRFLREREILASLEHPHIGRLYDGGLTADGRPYFVMEYVEGERLLDFCDQRALAVRHRIELFRQVCDAVSYAHRNLVVHRDLKPSNILVTTNGQPKLLDFGLAKVLDPERPGETLDVTRLGPRFLTPEYASPEQVRGETVTTATDVYSLGVILFELLTGRRPYPVRGLRVEQVARIVLEVEPERPSAVLGRPADRDEDGTGAEALSRARATTPERLRRALAGDLDNIVLKALRKEPERRYGSVEALAEDLRCYLEGLPVQARPDSLPYRARKFIQRHRPGVAAAAAAVLLLAALTSFYTARLQRERDRARLEAAKAEQVAGFLTGLFELSDPERSRGQQLTTREILDRGALEVADELRDQPELQAEMMMLIGEVYRQLGLYAEARPLFAKAHATRLALLGEDSTKTADSLRKLGLTFHLAGKYQQARPLLERARDAFERLGDPVGLAAALSDLAALHRAGGDLAGARALHERAIALKEVHEPESSSLAKSLNNLGLVLVRQGELERARRAYGRALDLHERSSGPDSILVAQTLDNLAWAIAEAGRPAEALPLAQRSLEIQQRALGEHRMVANALNTLGRLAVNLGDRPLADSYYERSAAMFEKTLGPDHPDTAFPIRNLGHGRLEAGKPEQALSFYERALQIRLKAFGPEHIDVALSLRDLAGARAKTGDIEESLALYRRALSTMRQAVPPENPQVSETLLRLGKLLAEQDRCAEARPLIEEALALRRAQRPVGDPNSVEVEEALRRCAG